MDIAAYLARINYQGSLTPTADTLRALQLAHLLTVPFENLSIHWNEPIVLSDEALFAKIVTRRRGGFCYELNGLFGALLKALGFDVIMLAAAVAHDETSYGPPFDHMTLCVRLKEPWLVDVGFGDSFLYPLQLNSREEQIQGERRYHIEQGETWFYLKQQQRDEPWSAPYRFTLEAHQYPDYAAMCHYHQTSAESHFTQNRICSRATPRGRISLSGRRLIITEMSQRQEQILSSEADVSEVLRTQFGIVAQT